MDNNQQFNAPEGTKSGLAIAGFVCSCVSFFLPGFILIIIGFVLGIIGRNKSTDKTYRGLGTAAFIIAIVMFVLRVIGVIVSVILFSLGILTPLIAPLLTYFAMMLSY